MITLFLCTVLSIPTIPFLIWEKLQDRQTNLSLNPSWQWQSCFHQQEVMVDRSSSFENRAILLCYNASIFYEKLKYSTQEDNGLLLKYEVLYTNEWNHSPLKKIHMLLIAVSKYSEQVWMKFTENHLYWQFMYNMSVQVFFCFFPVSIFFSL